MQDKNDFYGTPRSFDTLSLNRICLKFAFKLNLFSHEARWPLESQGVIEPIYESPWLFMWMRRYWQLLTWTHSALEDSRWRWHCLDNHNSHPSSPGLSSFSSSDLSSWCHSCCCCCCCCKCDWIGFHKGKVWPPPPPGCSPQLHLGTQSKPGKKFSTEAGIWKCCIEKCEQEHQKLNI